MRTTDAVLDSLREAREVDAQSVDRFAGWRALRHILAGARVRADRPAMTELAVSRALGELERRHEVERLRDGTWRARAERP